MATLAQLGLKNSNKRQLNRHDDDHDTSATHKSKRSKRNAASSTSGMLNQQVTQSLFGEKGVNLKQQIRSIKRLINKPDLPADVKQRKAIEVKILEDQLLEKEKSDRQHRIDKKYKMIKFVEHQKLIRKMKSLQKQLLSLTSTDKTMSHEERKIRQDIDRTQKDLDYIQYYPKGMKYIALFPAHKSPSATANNGEIEDDDDDDVVIEAAKKYKEKATTEEKEEPEGHENVENAAAQHAAAQHAAPQHAAPQHAAPQHAGPQLHPQRVQPAISSVADVDLEQQRESIRVLVKKAKEKASQDGKKSSSAHRLTSSTISTKKEKRRREFKDPFFTPVDDNTQQHKQPQGDEEQQQASDDFVGDRRGQQKPRQYGDRRDQRSDRYPNHSSHDYHRENDHSTRYEHNQYHQQQNGPSHRDDHHVPRERSFNRQSRPSQSHRFTEDHEGAQHQEHPFAPSQHGNTYSHANSHREGDHVPDMHSERARRSGNREERRLARAKEHQQRKDAAAAAAAATSISEQPVNTLTEPSTYTGSKEHNQTQQKRGKHAADDEVTSATDRTRTASGTNVDTVSKTPKHKKQKKDSRSEQSETNEGRVVTDDAQQRREELQKILQYAADDDE